jgi:hypothetical protein
LEEAVSRVKQANMEMQRQLNAEKTEASVAKDNVEALRA